MKTYATFFALVLFAAGSARATDSDPCEADLLSRTAVRRRIDEVKPLVPSHAQMFAAIVNDDATAAMAAIGVTASTGRPVAEARESFDRLTRDLRGAAALTRFAFTEPQTIELLLMSYDADLAPGEIITRLAAMADAMGPRGGGTPVLMSLVKISIYTHRTPEEVIAVLDQVRRQVPAVERRVRDAHAAVVARHAGSRLRRSTPWFTDEVIMAITESIFNKFGRASVEDALAVTADVLSDEIAATSTGPEQEAIIKAAIVLDRPIRDSMNQLAEFKARTVARFGESLDENIEPLLQYMMLLGGRSPADVIDFVDHLVATGGNHSELLAVAVIARTAFALAGQAPRPSLLRGAQFNAFH